MLSNITEAKSRGADVIGVGEKRLMVLSTLLKYQKIKILKFLR